MIDIPTEGVGVYEGDIRGRGCLMVCVVMVLGGRSFGASRSTSTGATSGYVIFLFLLIACYIMRETERYNEGESQRWTYRERAWVCVRKDERDREGEGGGERI